MHFLVGFVIVIGLITFGFGARTAQAVVRATGCIILLAIIAFVTWLAYDLNDGGPERGAKITAAYRTTPARTCVEWTNWRPTTVDNCKKWSDGSPTTIRTSAPLSSYATSCWKWSTQDKTMVPVGCDDADALTGPPGGEPRCGAACAETAHSDTNVRRAAK
jgi:hypothetical protein